MKEEGIQWLPSGRTADPGLGLVLSCCQLEQVLYWRKEAKFCLDEGISNLDYSPICFRLAILLFLTPNVKILAGQTITNTVFLFLISAASSKENSVSLISQYYVNVGEITVVDV